MTRERVFPFQPIFEGREGSAQACDSEIDRASRGDLHRRDGPSHHRSRQRDPDQTSHLCLLVDLNERDPRPRGDRPAIGLKNLAGPAGDDRQRDHGRRRVQRRSPRPMGESRSPRRPNIGRFSKMSHPISEAGSAPWDRETPATATTTATALVLNHPKGSPAAAGCEPRRSRFTSKPDPPRWGQRPGGKQHAPPVKSPGREK